jgi:hypothetical protein
MTDEHRPHIERWLAHIKYLADEIGPRGSTTQGERLGAQYCHEILSALELDPQIEKFRSARSIYHPHLLTAIIMLLAFILYPLFPPISPWLAVVLSLGALASDLLELSLINNPLRWVTPKGDSQNVVATLPPAGEHRQDLILIGHVDSHRTPLIFRSKGWVTAYKIFTTIAFVGFMGQVIVFILGALTGWVWPWYAASFSALCALLLALMCIEADSTPFSAGANDNASAAGLVLTLAQHLSQEPLNYTRVWLACTGCEEVQHYGAIDFFRRHRSEMINPHALVFELMGCAGPGFLTREGIIVPFQAHPKMLNLAHRIARQNTNLGAYPVKINGENTEMVDALRAGVPAISLFGLTPEGDAPYWHMAEDTPDKMDPEVMERAYTFTLKLIRTLDNTRPEEVLYV